MSKKSTTTSSEESDEIILQTYMLGWKDCPDGDDSNLAAFKDSKLLTRAYNIGWMDYIVGDDVSSVDLQTNEEILEKIKSK